TVRHSANHQRGVTLYFRKNDEDGFAAFVSTNRPLLKVDSELLEIFCTNIALCANNIDLVDALRRTAFVDRQLGIPNRTAMVNEIDSRAAAGTAMQCTLALMDIDQFSATNELFGSEFGDALLQATATRLREAMPD